MDSLASPDHVAAATPVGGGAPTPQTVQFTCPQCGWSGEFDRRFTAWCRACGHGAEPGAEPPRGNRAARREARGRARAEALAARLHTAADLRPGSGIGAVAIALSVAVHLVWVIVVAVVVYRLALAPGNFWSWVVALIGGLIAFEVRPRIGWLLRVPRAMRERGAYAGRDELPKLFALLDRCADGIDSPRVDRVRFSRKFNASTTRAGSKGTVFLHLGVPLWITLDGGQRVALLGHELGHQTNGDILRGAWGHTADESLKRWRRILTPQQSRAQSYRAGRYRRGGNLGPLVAVLMFILLLPFYLAVSALHLAHARLLVTCSQRAEFLADEYSARAGGTADALRLVEHLSLSSSVDVYVTRMRSSRSKDDLWSGLNDHLNSVPEHERQRRVVVDRWHGTRIDAAHPAHHLRHDLLAARQQRPRAVTVEDAEWAAIDAELKPFYDQIGRSMLTR